MRNSNEEALTRGQLAARLQISHRHLSRLIDEGCPVTGEGRRKRFLWSQVFPWHQARLAARYGGPKASALVAAQVRKLQIEGDRIALKLAKEKGLVVDVAEIRSAIETTCLNIRNRFLALPRGLASRLCGESRVQIEAILDEHIRAILEHLSQHAADLPPEPEEPATDPSAAVM